MQVTDIKIAIESMTFCQGNCQGCFFSEEERVGGAFLEKKKLEKISNFINDYAKDINDLDITLIFGQGDHLALKNDEIENLFSTLVSLNNLNPLVILTTSAIGKTDEIIEKIDLIKSLGIKFNIRLFMSVVIDPKKMLHSNFKSRYLKNIQYIRESFGFIDLAINIGKDTLEHISPEEFSSFLIENKFRHVELNLIPTINTVKKFNDSWNEIIEWLINFQNISENKNYLIFHTYKNQYRNQQLKDLEFFKIQNYLKNELVNHIYIANNLDVSLMLSGFTGNAIPYGKKTGYEPIFNIENYSLLELENHAKLKSLQILKNTMRNTHCINCEYNKICAFSGVDVFRAKEYISIHQDNCFLNIKNLLTKIIDNKNQCTGVDKKMVPIFLYKEDKNYFPLDDISSQISVDSLKV